MDEYAGRVLADRYRLPVLNSDAYDTATEARAFDTYSGQEVLVRQVPLPEVVEAEVLDADGLPEGFRPGAPAARGSAEPAVARAIEAA
ncbi:serine/threonine protein kinase, partial [Streptomyces sp. SID14478]|nr:serine/threonine protein kinase [Streptomyces sp. SID14478]